MGVFLGLEEDKEAKSNRTRAQLIATFMTIPFVLAVPPVIGWYLGSWLDKKWDTAPIIMYVLLLCGVIAGIREFYRIVIKYGGLD